ncbi:hypothetical protein BH09MYX1_BH09MYX1_65930 [soil metagenome]
MQFDVAPGMHGGIGEATTIPALEEAAQAMKPCFPAPTKTELWSVYVACQWPKGGPRSLSVQAQRNDVSDASPQAAQIAACAKTKLDQTTIPDAVGQDDLGGKPAYASLRVGYFPFRHGPD